MIVFLFRLLLVLLLSWFDLDSSDSPSESGGALSSLVATLSTRVADELNLTRLAEILDEPLSEILDEPFGDEPVVELPPEDNPSTELPDGGARGAIGGGVSEGPEVGATVPPPIATSTFVTLPPTATPPPPPTVPIPTSTATSPVATAVPPTATVPVPALVRVDEPVLRWLPELKGASQVTGVPIALLAAVIQVESGGDPSQIAVDGGRGLIGVQPADLTRLGVPPEEWYTPARNILAGAQVLASAYQLGGSWNAALITYTGPSCAVSPACFEPYVAVTLQWRDYYERVLADPVAAGFRWLPADWQSPPIVPYQLTAPRPLVSPPGYVMPTAIVEATLTATATATATATVQTTPTQAATGTSTATVTATMALTASVVDTPTAGAPTPTA